MARILLRRADVANRLESADIDILKGYFAQVDADPRIRVLVIGSTGKHFCSGYNTSDLTKLSVLAIDDDYINPFAPLVDGLHAVGKPVIAAISGGIFGGAIDLCLACDFRIGTSACQMRMPALRIGFLYYASGLQRYVTRLGLQNTKRIFMTGRTFNSSEMLGLGVLDEVHDSRESMEKSVEILVSELSGMAPLAMTATKRSLESLATSQLDRCASARLEAELMQTSDYLEGVSAMAERREPDFTGR